MNHRSAIAGELPQEFDQLCRLLPPRPLRDEHDLDNATELAHALAVLSARSDGQNDYLETLSLLIEHYEHEHWAIETDGVDAVSLLRRLMNDHAMNAGDLGRLMGDPAAMVEVLDGRARLDPDQMRRLGDHFRVDPGLFLRPSRD
jgi:HTH-type transcriptional regulator / antitoxin HigA